MSDNFEAYLSAFAETGLKCEWKPSGDGMPTLTISHPESRYVARFATRNQKWRIKRNNVGNPTKYSGQGLSKLIDWFQSQTA